MVHKLRKALAGFLLLRSDEPFSLPSEPCDLERSITKASALRGYTNKDAAPRLMVLKGHDEGELMRALRTAVVENERPGAKFRFEDGVHLTVFRGVFGSGGYSLSVDKTYWEGRDLVIVCTFESPGEGIRTTAGFTQPTAFIPLKRLPPGAYGVRVEARETLRVAQGVSETAPLSRLALKTSFKVFA
jgi:hypothetical protein